jgi:hypothetical protein
MSDYGHDEAMRDLYALPPLPNHGVEVNRIHVYICDLERRLVEYDEACESAGLPHGCAVADFVQHHRGNAGLAAAFDSAAELTTLREQYARLVEAGRHLPDANIGGDNDYKVVTVQRLGDHMYVGTPHHAGTTSLYDIICSFEYGSAMTEEHNVRASARAYLIADLLNAALEPTTASAVCPTCGGSGRMRHSEGMTGYLTTCRTCHGTGEAS